jgi:hypothetical protein
MTRPEIGPESIRWNLSQGAKDDDGKVPLDLISPEFLYGVAHVLGFGAQKYAPYNWAKGILFSRVYSALQRHLTSWYAGEENDEETGMSHLWHAGCCLMFLTHYASRPSQYKSYDDRPNYAEAAQSPS